MSAQPERPRPVRIELSPEQALIVRDALGAYARSRLRIARRRDRLEGGGPAVERALAGFFAEVREADAAVRRAVREWRAEG